MKRFYHYGGNPSEMSNIRSLINQKGDITNIHVYFPEKENVAYRTERPIDKAKV